MPPRSHAPRLTRAHAHCSTENRAKSPHGARDGRPAVRGDRGRAADRAGATLHGLARSCAIRRAAIATSRGSRAADLARSVGDRDALLPARARAARAAADLARRELAAARTRDAIVLDAAQALRAAPRGARLPLQRQGRRAGGSAAATGAAATSDGATAARAAPAALRSRVTGRVRRPRRRRPRRTGPVRRPRRRRSRRTGRVRRRCCHGCGHRRAAGPRRGRGLLATACEDHRHDRHVSELRHPATVAAISRPTQPSRIAHPRYASKRCRRSGARRAKPIATGSPTRGPESR